MGVMNRLNPLDRNMRDMPVNKARILITLAVFGALMAYSNAVTPVASAQDAKSTPQAIRHYSNAVKAHNNKAYSLAADEWSSFLAKYPADPLAPKAKYYLGVCHMQTKDLEKAAAQFGSLTSNAKFELIDDVRFNLGWTQYTMAQAGKKELFPKAAATFASLVQGNPKSDKAAQALYYQGECEYAQEKREAAAKLYGQVAADYPEAAIVCDALYAQGVALEEAEKYPEAGAVYDLFLNKCAKNELLTEVQMRKAETILQSGKFDEAATIFQTAAKSPDFALADHAAYRGAYCLAKLDKFAEAGAAYAALCTTFTKSTYVPGAEMGAARAFYKAGDNANASNWLDKVIARDGDDYAEAAHWRCKLHLDAGEAPAAAKLAAAALPKAAESPFLPNLKLDQADALYADESQRANAVKQYEAIATDHADSGVAPQALYYAAFGALDAQNFKDALRLADKFLATYKESDLLVDVQYVHAESNLLTQKYPEAETEFKALTTAKPDHPDQELWNVRYGLALYLQKKYKETITAMQAALPNVKGAANKAELLYLVGGSQFFDKQYEPAVGTLEKSLAADAKWRKADETMLLLGRAQAKIGNNTQAVATINKLLTDFPETTLAAHAHYRLGECQYAEGKLDDAVANYDKSLAADGESAFAPYAQYGKGWTLFKAKKYDPAIATLTAMLTASKDHVLAKDAQFARAMCYRQANKSTEALADLDAYLKTDGLTDQQACDALYEKGLAEVALMKHAESVASFQDILKRQPDYADADKVLYEIGWSQKSLNKEEAALKAFGELASKHPDSGYAGEAHYHLGEKLYADGSYPEAQKEYQAAREKTKENKDILEKALFKLGWSLFQQQKYPEAAVEFGEQLKAAADGPLSGDGGFMQAECLFRSKKHAEAMPLFVKATTSKLSSPTMKVLSQLHAGQCATQLKKWQEGYDLLKGIPTDFPDTPYLAEAYYERGWAQQNLNKNAEALADYRAAADAGNGVVVARARFMAGEILFGDKKYEDATKEFQRVMFFFADSKDPAVKNWQAKSGYEAGRCAEVQIMDEKDPAKKASHIANAKKFYGYVVKDHADHELAKESQKRLDVLAKL